MLIAIVYGEGGHGDISRAHRRQRAAGSLPGRATVQAAIEALGIGAGEDQS